MKNTVIETNIRMMKFGHSLSATKKGIKELAGTYGKTEYNLTDKTRQLLAEALKERTKAGFIAKLVEADEHS